MCTGVINVENDFIRWMLVNCNVLKKIAVNLCSPMQVVASTLCSSWLHSIDVNTMPAVCQSRTSSCLLSLLKRLSHAGKNAKFVVNNQIAQSTCGPPSLFGIV